MKTLLAGIATLAGLVLLPTTASADLTFMGRCGSCGVPMYGQTIVSGYDRCGHPILRTVPVTHYCQARHSDHHRGGDCHGSSRYEYNRGYGYDRSDYGYGRSGYGYGGGYGYDSRRSGCDSRPRVGFSISILR